MAAVHRREEVDHSRSLEGGATGPGGSEKTQGDARIRVTVPRPLNYVLILPAIGTFLTANHVHLSRYLWKEKLPL